MRIHRISFRVSFLLCISCLLRLSFRFTGEFMLVIFRRTGWRRYGIEIQRERFPAVKMDPAPGYDPLMPHDLLHLVVEAQLGLKRGIFGQVAAGGHAGSFRTYIGPAKNSRDAARRQRRIDRRGEKLLRRVGANEMEQSERATYICWQEWLARSKSSSDRERANVMSFQAKQVLSVTPENESCALSEDKLEQICAHLDELSSHWTGLKIGESMTVQWPDLSVHSSTND